MALGNKIKVIFLSALITLKCLNLKRKTGLFPGKRQLEKGQSAMKEICFDLIK